MKEFVRIVNVLRICMSLQEFKRLARIRKNATCTSICKESARFVKNCKKNCRNL